MLLAEEEVYLCNLVGFTLINWIYIFPTAHEALLCSWSSQTLQV